MSVKDLILTVHTPPAPAELPACRAWVRGRFPHPDNEDYWAALETDRTPPAVAAERWGVLSLLARALEAAGVDTRTLILRRDEHGRPYFDPRGGLPCPLDFNLSHTDRHVACALLMGEGRVGVDVEEPIAPARAKALLDRFGTDGERAWMASDPRVDFARLWTVREACAKQIGEGRPVRFDASAPPVGRHLCTARLPDTGAALAVCLPRSLSPNDIECLPDSLPVVWDA